jgi:signal transduction histidine kinase
MASGIDSANQWTIAMENKTNLSHRIVWSFLLMTFCVSSVFAIVIFLVVHQVEENLLSTELNRTMDRMQHNNAHPSFLTPNHVTRFYSEDQTQNSIAIPENLKNLNEGFHEIIDGDEAYHVLVRMVKNQRYILMQDQTDFEAREKILYLVVFLGVILSLIVAWLLGNFLAKRVIAPVVELSEKVTQHQLLTDTQESLSPYFANDEVGQLASAFDNAFGQLSEAIQRERLFTADVSHELRTPLMVISSSAELLLEDDTLTTNKKEHLLRISQAAKNMQSLVEIFLQLARNNTNDKAQTSMLSSHSMSLAEVAASQINHWQPTAHHQKLVLQLIEDGLPEQHYNSALLTAVISNLLRNALHYTLSGSVNLRLTREGFTVEDTGPGIPSEQRKEVFLPFRRGSNTQTDGLGLGLSLVQRICEHEGWNIELEENQPQGCCFRVTF